MTETAHIINFPDREPKPQEQTVVKADTDKGFYRVANELGLALCKTSLSDREGRLLEAVKVKTYGFNKAMDWICNDQLAEMTEIDVSNISKVKAALVSRRILIKDGKKIGINPVISEWQKKSELTNKKSESTRRKSELTTEKVRTDPHKRQDNITKDNTSSSAKKFTDDDLKCAKYILSLCKKLKSDFKANLDKWADTIRLMRERDKRTHREICELFKWANEDSFWQTNILSPTKLRQQWDKLYIKRGAASSTTGGYDASRDSDTSWIDGLVIEVPVS